MAAILPLADAVSSGRINSAATGYPRWGPSYGPKGRQRLAMIDVPRQPVHSIIEFTNADLGKYQVAPTIRNGLTPTHLRLFLRINLMQRLATTTYFPP